MNIRYTLTAIATGAALLLTAPAQAGGPVITEETTEVSPAHDRNGWIVPTVVGLLILCAIACGGSDDAPPVVVPGPVCNKEGC